MSPESSRVNMIENWHIDFTLIMDILNISGGICSIIGLVITIFVLITVKNIRTQYLFTARIPDLKKSLAVQASKIIELLNDYQNNIDGIVLELAKTEPILNSLIKTLGRRNRASTKNLVRLVKEYRKKVRDNTSTSLARDAYDIYTEMHTILGEINERTKDAKWER